MAGETLGTAANGFVVLNTPIGSDAASSRARIDTFQVEAGLAVAALFVLGALRVATGEGISQKVGRARADGTVVLVCNVPVLFDSLPAGPSGAGVG